MKIQWKLRRSAKKKTQVLKEKREEKTCRCGNGGMTEAIQKYGIRWQVSPVTTSRGWGAHPVGFYLELFGTHSHPECLPAKDCPECQAVIRGLNQVLDELLPQQPDEKSDFLTVYRPSIGYSSRAGFRIEAVISLMIPDDKQGQRAVDPILMDTCLTSRRTLRALRSRNINERTPKREHSIRYPNPRRPQSAFRGSACQPPGSP